MKKKVLTSKTKRKGVTYNGIECKFITWGLPRKFIKLKLSDYEGAYKIRNFLKQTEYRMGLFISGKNPIETSMLLSTLAIEVYNKTQFPFRFITTGDFWQVLTEYLEGDFYFFTKLVGIPYLYINGLTIAFNRQVSEPLEKFFEERETAKLFTSISSQDTMSIYPRITGRLCSELFIKGKKITFG